MSHSTFVRDDAVILQTGSNYEAQVLEPEFKTKATVSWRAENCKKWDKALEIHGVYATETYIFNISQ